MRHSIRFRVTALAAAVIAIVMVATTAALLLSQNRQLTSAIDDTLRVELEAVLTADGVDISRVLSDRTAAQVVQLDGTVIASTAGLSETQPMAPMPVADSVVSVQQVPIDDDPYRVLSRRIATTEGDVVVHIGINAEDVGESTRALMVSAVVLVPVVVAALATMVWWMVGRTLQPVEAIRRGVAAIGVERGGRVPVPETEDEVGRLARTMNEMLERIDTSIERQQRFVADASHELRTPLTRIRTEVEVARADAEGADPGGVSAPVLESILEETIAMQSLIDDLLLLARADAGAMAVGQDLVDLDDLALIAADRLRSEGVNVDATGVSASQARGSEAQLSRVVANLVDNAVRHAASTVWLSTYERDGSAWIVVGNDGPTIPADSFEAMFQRFGRLDESRAQQSGGAGLGLAIVQEIVARHGGSVTVTSIAGDTRFLVALPLPQAPSANG